MIRGHILLTVICTVAGFNIFTKPVKHFHNNDTLFGQTTVQSKEGVLVPSPNSRPQKVLHCDLENCMEVNISANASKGLRPIVAVTNSLTGEKEQHMVCQQVRKQNNSNDYLNANCTLLSGLLKHKVYYPATLVVDQMERNISINGNNHNNKNNNNNNNNSDEDDEDDPGTEIAFVLDGSGSINVTDFERAKHFISTVMKNVWEKCFNCEFAIVQYGSKIRTELSLNEKDGPKAFETVKNIEQIKHATITASAIIYTIEHVFVPENGSKEDSKKIIIVVSDGAISLWDKIHLPKAKNLLETNHITRFAIGVGNETKIDEMKMISGSESNLFLVGDYKALESILSQLETSIIKGIEGIKQGDGFQFQLAEAGFSNHIALDGSLLFGAVGANDWSGGVILKHPKENKVTFLNGSSSEPRFSYLGYSVVSAMATSGTLYISGAPRHSLTGGVFVFNATSHKLQEILLGDQVGSYFGSVLCALDFNGDTKTDYLLVGAPYFHQRGEEGRVIIFKLNQAKGEFDKESWEWHGLDSYVFARFGSAISSVGDLDGNGYNDVAVGAPLEEDEICGCSGSIYIYNGVQEGLQRDHSQRIKAAEFETKLRHFGQSVSAFSDKKGADRRRQLHIIVGSQGTVTVLRTIPVIVFKPKLTMKPNTIPTSAQTNTKTKKEQVTLAICFQTQKGNIDTDEQLPISYNIDLDAGQNKKRLSFEDKANGEGIFTILSDTDCLNPIKLFFTGCYDCFSPIEVKLNFKLNTTEPPLRILDFFTPTEFTEKIQFEKECEIKDKCMANISLSDSRLSKDMVIIGSTQNLMIDFNLTNIGDSAYMTTLVLAYPNMLLFNKFTTKMEGSVCENQIKENISCLKCHLLHPVFKKNTQVNFSISWQPVNKKSEMREAEITANLTCENGGTQVLDFKTYHFGIKNALKVQLTGEATPNIIKFTDKTIEKKDLTFKFQLHGENKHNTTIYVNVTITVQAHDTKMTIKSTTPKERCVIPANAEVKAFGEYLIQCAVTDVQEITVEAEASIREVQGKSEKITAKATLGFDEDQFEALELRSMESVEVMIIKLVVEKSLPVIIGGSIGGFLFLAIIIVILVKCGFFKRRHQEDKAMDTE
ncbi:integrin alpha-E [Coregonus clupeaformis]|uniref:integrin alpha-E n=1 Tax=Coregonus clupeaformis TaxID=59861 RepID=UPI001BE12618|nr:integrin alpha-E [Coregonus clupeaformis]